MNERGQVAITLRKEFDGEYSIQHMTFIEDNDSRVKTVLATIPEVEEKDGMSHEFKWNDETKTLEVVYKEIEKTEVELLREEIEKLKQSDVYLGTQVTDVDLNLLEHIVNEHGAQ